jgi:Carbohydrate binding domain
MADSAPRHLAEPSKRFGLSPLQQVFLVALVSLAAITAVIALLTRDAGNGGRRAAAPATTQEAATTATTAAATTTTAPASTTAPATRPVRATPGNLLADGDFERDLAGWAPLGGAEVERVEGGESGRWAAAVSPGGGSGAGRPGMVRRDAATTEAGTTYEAIFWVQAPEGGQVVLALRELAGGREVSADQAGYALPGGRWQQIAVEHQTAAPGSSLALEVLGYDLPGDGRLLVDGVDLQTE